MPVPAGQSAISLKGSILLIALLHVRVDGVLVTLQDVLGNGTVGEVFVTPGSHTVTISNAADDAVLFETTVNCPDCSGGVLGETAPPTDVAGTTGGNVSGGGMLFILIGLAGLILTTAFVAPTRASRRKRP